MDSDPFAKLPFELVLDICQYLPTESIVCLALSKKYLYQSQELREIWQPRMDSSQPILGIPEVSAARDSESDQGTREILLFRKDIRNNELLRTLKLLHRNLTDRWLCDICMKLHLRVAYTEDGRAYTPCDQSRRQGLLYSLPAWNYGFPFEHAQQVVKQHTQGAPHGSPLTILQRHKEWEKINDWPIQPLIDKEQSPLVWYKRLKITPENHT